MPEPGSRTPASLESSMDNVRQIGSEMGRSTGIEAMQDYRTTRRLRAELSRSGLTGFKRGGRVRRTGIYQLHAGERVIAARGRRRGRR